METKDKSMCYGYIVKLYKTINAHKESSVPKKTEFLVWMNFDGMKIIPVEYFDKYRQSLDIMSLQDIDLTCERQKLYLYTLDENKDIFGLEKDSNYEKLPLVVITMINFYNECMPSKELDKSLEEVISEYRSASSGIQIAYEIMGTLSSHDYIIVFRGNSYNFINDVIFGLRIKANSKKHPISSTYSILAINKKDKLNWNGDKEIYASIRITLDAIRDPVDVVNEYNKNNNPEKILTNQDQYTTFGKFDMGIEGNIQEDKSKFLALYEDPNIFSGKEKSIYMTNTRFLNRLFLDSSKMVDEKQDHDEIKKILLREEEGFNSAESMAGKMIVQLKDSNVSEKLKQSILRLILRVFQSNISVYTNRHSQMFLELLGGLMKLLKKWGEGSEYQVSIAEIVTALNILLDNRISANTRDFEIPQNSLRFSGSSSKLLVAYSNVVSDLTSIIKKYKESIEQPLKYLVFVTADIDSKISSKLFFPRDNDFRFLNVKIPIDMMYNVQYTIPWLIHEIGHFLRGYKREERNRSYFKCVFSAFHIIAKPYLNKSFLDGSVDLGHKKVCNAKCCDVFEECNKQECRFERFDDYAILIQRFWIMYILESGCQRNSVYNIPDKRKGKYIQDMHEISVGIKDAYEEGIADVFMIRVLQIDDCVHYLKIMIEYFDNNRINIDTNLSTNIVIRIIAILIYISKAYKEHQKGYRIFEEHIEGIRTQNVSVKMNNLCDTILSKGQFYSVAEILSEFLASKIEKGMDELFKRDDVIKLQERIFQSYSDIVTFPDEFKNYISFITEFQK